MNARSLVLSCFVLVSLVGFAAAEGFELPNLNPFSKPKQPGKMQARLPKMEIPKPNLSGAWRTVNNGAKGLLTGTKRVLMPWNKPKRPPAFSPTGSVVSKPYGRYKEPEKSKPSVFQAIFSPNEEEKPRPRTVNEFLNKPRVPRP